MRFVSPELDHIIVGARDLEEGIAYLEKLSGYRAAYGGAHPGRGTCNALLKLGHQSYLEILAPDPQQSVLAWHKALPTLEEPCLVGWALRAAHINGTAPRKPGSNLIGPIPGSRTLPNGDTLRWTLLLREDDRAGILPFFIEWDPHSKHPSDNAPGGCLILDLQRTGQLVETSPPRPGLHIKKDASKPVQLHATIAGQLGEFVLTSRSVPTEYWSPPELP
jgi:Glyoxalase-like domain